MESQMSEDFDYIEQFLSGEERAFEALVRKYQNKVLNIVYSLIGRDRDSEDIAQEAFLKVYHSLSSFKQKCQFSTWLYRIVVNTAYDFLRKRKHLVSNDAVLEAAHTFSAGPQEELLMKEKQMLINNALTSVPFKFRAAVVLKDMEGLSYSEISRVLGCSIGTVESRIYRARQFLKVKLSRAGGDLL